MLNSGVQFRNISYFTKRFKLNSPRHLVTRDSFTRIYPTFRFRCLSFRILLLPLEFRCAKPTQKYYQRWHFHFFRFSFKYHYLDMKIIQMFNFHQKYHRTLYMPNPMRFPELLKSNHYKNSKSSMARLNSEGFLILEKRYWIWIVQFVEHLKSCKSLTESLCQRKLQTLRQLDCHRPQWGLLTL